MVLPTTELSPRQKAAIAAKIGRRLQGQENVVLPRGMASVASAQEREHAAQRMRYQLYLLDPSERRMSIEDYTAVLLEKADIA